MSDPTSRDGLAAALLRGEAARVQWVRDGLVVRAQQLAQAWQIPWQALPPAVARGEIFSATIGSHNCYPQGFLSLDRQTVTSICLALSGLSPSEKFIFWTRRHGSLAGRCVHEAVLGGIAVARVERLAAAWAQERTSDSR